MTITKELRQSDESEIRDLLLGRRIVSAETGSFSVAARTWPATGRLVLDDGTEVLVRPNEGGCSCGAGDYSIEHLATVDNVITDVRTAEEGEEHWGDWAGAYRIYVVADAVEVNVLSVEGDDGNGYYGTGYELFVVANPGQS
jgi:hypothetical protein